MDGKHFTRFQIENAVFKFLQRGVNGPKCRDVKKTLKIDGDNCCQLGADGPKDNRVVTIWLCPCYDHLSRT